MKRILSLKKKNENLVWNLIGDQNPEILLVGHSHRTTMALALRNVKTSKKLAVLMESSGPYKIPHPDTGYWDFILKNKISSLKKVIVIWQGHLSLIDFLFRAEQPFKLVSEQKLNEIKISEDLNIKSIVLEKDIINIFEKYFQNDGLNEILRIYKENNYETFLLSSPPPKSKIFINSILQNEVFFKEMYDELTKNSTNQQIDLILDDEYRVRIWELMQEALQNTAISTDAKFIPIPKHLMHKQGILREDYYLNDVSHANEMYSEELWKFLIRNEII